MELLVYRTPGLAGPDFDGARCLIVCHLGKPSGVDMNSLCRREPGIRNVTTTLHLKQRGAVLDV